MTKVKAPIANGIPPERLRKIAKYNKGQASEYRRQHTAGTIAENRKI